MHCVRPQAGQALKDAPVDVKAKIKLSNKLLHYVLIRKGNTYVYDIRENFKASTYNYKNASAHNGNSASLLTKGARVYKTGGKLAHIPSWKRLDFSLGITAFDNNWAGNLPNGKYSREVQVDFTRFYTYSGNKLNSKPQWQDEFSGSSLNYGKWFAANWSFAKTQFRQNNVRVKNGRLYLKINN